MFSLPDKECLFTEDDAWQWEGGSFIFFLNGQFVCSGFSLARTHKHTSTVSVPAFSLSPSLSLFRALLFLKKKLEDTLQNIFLHLENFSSSWKGPFILPFLLHVTFANVAL